LINDLSENDFDDTMTAFNLGTQTWNEGRLRFLVAGYYFNGVETQIHTIPESISNLNDLSNAFLIYFLPKQLYLDFLLLNL